MVINALLFTQSDVSLSPPDYKAVKDVQKLGKELQGGLNKNNLKKDVTVSISIGSSKSTSEQDTDSETASRAGITAGDTLTMTARTGDVTLQGASINAKDITIEADQDINIKDAQNKEKTDSKSDSSSWALGVSLNAGLFGNASNGNSNGNGTVVTHSGTEINATDTVDLHSGRDTNIIGSQVKGKEVIANVGRDLNIASQQDIDNYAEKSSSSGIGFSTGPSGGVTGSVSKGKINSEYSSVTEQAGIYAGEGGFDITVGKNTDLKGAVISSEAPAVKNAIRTGTLTLSNLENRAKYLAKSSGVNLDTRKNAEKKDAGLTPNIGVKVSGDADSTTQSAISPGTIEIRSNPNQDISNLSRDPANSVNALGKIFDKKTVQEKQELAQVFGEVAFDAIGTLAEREKRKVTTPEEKAKWEEGGEYKVALHALVGGIMSDLGGSNFASGAVGAGVSQAVQNELSKITNPALRQWASALVGAAAAKVVGGNGQAGASTAASGIKNNDYNHRTHREGEIVHTKDGWFQVINGVDTAIEAPPAGYYFWEQDSNNGDYGWDYKKGDGIDTVDTYFSGKVVDQYTIFGQRITITDYTDAQKHDMAVEGFKKWGEAETYALAGGGMVGNVTAIGTATTVVKTTEEAAAAAKATEETVVAEKATDAVRTVPESGKSQWYKPDGSINYPPNGGAIPGTEVNRTLETGEVIGRYGEIKDTSNYMTEAGVDPSTLSLPPTTDGSKYQEFRVVKPIPGVTQSKAAAWGGDPGGGLQYELPMSINQLIKEGYIVPK